MAVGGKSSRLRAALRRRTSRSPTGAGRLALRYRKLFENNPDGIVITRPRIQRIVEINDAALAIVGVSREKALGTTTVELVQRSNLDYLNGLRARALAGARILSEPATLYRHDGGQRDVLFSGEMVKIGGEPHLVLTLRDVTAERQRERELAAAQSGRRQSLAMFATLFEINPQAVVVTRPRTKTVVEINRAALALFGVTREQAVGATSQEVFNWIDPERLLALRDRVVAGERAAGVRAQARTRDGRALDVVLAAGAVQVEGETLLVISMQDVTDSNRAEAALRESEARFRSAMQDSAIGMALSSPAGRWLEVNPALCRILGRSREELLETTWESLTHAEDLDANVKNFRRAVAGELSSYQLEKRFIRKDGSAVWTQLNASVVRDPAGKVLQFVTQVQDITERREAEQAIRESEQRYRRLLNETPMPLAITDMETRRYIDANPAWLESLKLRHQDVVGRTSLEFGMEILENGFKERLYEELRRNLRIDGREVEVRVRGRVRNFLVSAHHSLREPGRILWALAEITQRKEAERALQESEKTLTAIARGVSAEVGEAFLRSLAAQIGRELPADYVSLAQKSGPGRLRTLVRWTVAGSAEQFEQDLSDLPLAAETLRSGATVIYPQGVRKLFPDTDRLRKDAIEGYVGTRLVDSQGEVIGYLAAASRTPIRKVALWKSMVEIFAARAGAEMERARAEAQVRELNVSLERRVAERTAELEAANRELDSFGYSVSHDLRAPLQAIAGFAGIMKDRYLELLPEEARRYLGRIEGNAKQMDELIHHLLQFSRTARAALARAPVDMQSLAASVLHDLRPGDAPGVEIGELPPALGDAPLLRQVWGNLIGNALKFSRGAERPEIRIGATNGGGMVEYYVRDNGAGFDMRHAHKLFGVFQRLHSAAEFEGTGVGLALASRIVARHGGNMQAEGEPGKGATFRFSLPAPSDASE